MMLPGHVHDPHFINEKLRLLDLQCLNQGMCLVRAEPGLAPGVVNFTSALIYVCVRGCCLVCTQFTDETEAGSISKVPMVRESGSGLQRKAARIQKHLHRPARVCEARTQRHCVPSSLPSICLPSVSGRPDLSLVVNFLL